MWMIRYRIHDALIRLMLRLTGATFADVTWCHKYGSSSRCVGR